MPGRERLEAAALRGRGGREAGRGRLLLVCIEASRSAPRSHGASWVDASALRVQRRRDTPPPGRGLGGKAAETQECLLRGPEWQHCPRDKAWPSTSGLALLHFHGPRLDRSCSLHLGGGQGGLLQLHGSQAGFLIRSWFCLVSAVSLHRAHVNC